MAYECPYTNIGTWAIYENDTMPKQIGNIKLYTLKEISEALNVTPETLRAYIQQNRLQGQKVGQKWYTTEESLREFFSGLNRK